MKRNWIRKMAVLLSLCLIFHSGFLDLAEYAYADTLNKVSNSIIQNEGIGSTEEIYESANDGSEVSSNNAVDTLSENDTESGEGNGTTTVSTEVTTDVSENSTTTEETTDLAESSTTQEEMTEDIGETETEETETVSENDTVSENETEESETEELRIPMKGIMAVEDSVPADAATFLAKVDAGQTEFYIHTTQDFINVQELCKVAEINGFSGITFKISYPTDVTEQYWDTEKMAAAGFVGIGTGTYPFKGKMTGAFDYTTSSTHLELDRPIFSRMADGASFTNMKIVAKGCESAIVSQINSGTITLADLDISGTIGKGKSTGNAGTIATHIWGRTTIKMTNVHSTADVTGIIVGAIAGRIYANVNVVWPDGYVLGSSTNPIDIIGTYGTGGLYGYVTGAQTIDLTYFEHIAVDVIGNNGGGISYAGQLVGIIDGAYNSNAGSTVTITGGESLDVNVNSENGTIAGGLIGLANTYVTLTLPSNFTVNGTVNGGAKIAGGIIGVVRRSGITLNNITVNADVSAYTAGGIIGQLGSESILDLGGSDPSKMIIDTPTVNGTVDGVLGAGGIVGEVDVDCALELRGTVTVQDNLVSASDCIGSIAAKQNCSLIYLEGIEGKDENGNAQLNVPMSGSLPKYNDVYYYGGVFRNQDMGNGVRLIGDGTIENVGVINNKITDGKLGESGTSDAVADLETFAIANFTHGYFGLDGVFTDVILMSDLLSDDYVLYNDADISYETTGIITLNRNGDASLEEQYAFSGSLSGVDANITITQNTYLYQCYVGLFSSLAGDAAFSNLIIEGNVTRSSYVGGLAYQTFGSSLTLENIQMKKNFSSVQKEVAGILAKESSDERFTLNAKNVTLASVINVDSFSEFSGFINTLEDAKVNMEDIVLGGSISSSVESEGTKVGGLLGFEWLETGGTITDISVLEGTKYQSNGKFGALFYKITNQSDSNASKIKMVNVDLNHLTVTMNGQNNCALLVQNGKLLILDLNDYSAAGVTVNGASSDFDELIAINDVRGESSTNTYGVLSIHNSSELFYGSTGYHYENQATYTSGEPVENGDTRYLYDVFYHLENEDGTAKVVVNKDSDYHIVDSAVKFFLISIVQNLDKPDGYSQLTNYFKKFFADDKTPKNYGKYYLMGTLDLTPYSVYPMARQGNCAIVGKNDAKIIFAANGMEDWSLPNIDINDESQHYRLHCGIFNTTYSGGIKVDNITLSGSVGCLGNSDAGAIVCGTLNGDAEFTNITLDGLYLSSYGEFSSSSSKNKAGLLVGYIRDFHEDETDDETKIYNSIIFDNIQMINYTKNPYSTGGEGQAAAALICEVGDEDTKGIAIKFTRMKLQGYDVISASNDHGVYLKYASYIYDYEYTDDAAINKGSGLYLFTEQDEAEGWVTYGAELDYDTEYYDTVNKVLAEDAPAPESVWIPYVYKVKDIEVNPKSGDVLKGCGTYEDPYIIESAKQFLTLYRYINEIELDENNTQYQHQTFYTGWKVIKTGTDADVAFCADKHESAVATADASQVTRTVIVDGVSYSFTGSEDVRVFGESDFPTPDQLSQAYYQLDEDIDLSVLRKGTYAQIAQEFSGFGTNERPFTGIWYGKDPKNGNIHTVTLPNKKSDSIYTDYGFIKYAKGAVVKDLNLATSTTFAEGYTYANVTNEKETGVAGSVFAYIVGGDNIIDNVTTSVQLRTKGNSIIGGYVGNVKKGGLILRNMTDASIQNFRLYYSQDNGMKHLWHAIAGKVEDGYILYEGSSSGEEVLTAKTYNILDSLQDAGGSLEPVSAVSNYSIVDGVKLKADASKNGGIQLSVSEVEGGTNEKNVTITIPNAASLQVMAMAMNADALNVCNKNYRLYNDEGKHWGYANDSRSRKASYEDIGCITMTSDYLSAVKYDNMMGYDSDKAFAYPYLYDYMGITGEEYLAVTMGDYSILNPREPLSQNTYYINWELAENSEYDLTVYKEAFRGIGALYYPASYQDIASTFRGNLDGKNSTVIYDIKRELYWDYDTDSKPAESQQHAGLFNILATQGGNKENIDICNNVYDFSGLDGTSIQREAFIIKNVKVKGDVDVVAIGKENPDKKTRYYNVCFGGIVGEVYTGNYVFENISTPEANPMQVIEDEDLLKDIGGVVGTITNAYSYILFKDCNFKGSAENKVILQAYEFAGGLVGICKNERTKILNCSGEYLDIASTSQNAGGLLGHVGQKANYKFIVEGSGTQQTPISVKNSTVTAYYQVGAIIGETRCSSEIYNVYSENNAIGSYKSMGGIIGEAGYFTDATTSMEKVVVKDLSTINLTLVGNALAGRGCVGGVVGAGKHVLSIKDAEVTGRIEADTYSSIINGYVDKTKEGILGIGGIVGVQTSNPLTLENCSVANIYIEGIDTSSATANKTIGVGGLCGYNDSSIVLMGENEVCGSKIKTRTGADSAKKILAAGGCFGLVRAKIGASSNDAYYENLVSDANNVIGKYAGGIVGRLDVYTADSTTYSGEVRLQGAKVSNGSILSDAAAGGLIGYAQPGVNGFGFNETRATDETDANVISDMTIKGCVAGGGLGYGYFESGNARFQNVKIANSQIIATTTQEDMAVNAGGLLGETYFSKSKWLRVYDCVLSGNVIAAETATEELDAPEKYAAGGVLGRMTGTSLKGDLFCDRITLQNDNKIGLRLKDDTSDEAVKLVKVTDSEFELADISDADLPKVTESIAKNSDALEILQQEYGYCVGTFVGSMDSVTSQFYVICSNDSAEEFTIPVMTYNPPVTDVGVSAAIQLDETDASYYRKGAHIIYGAPVTERDVYKAADSFKNVDFMKTKAEEAGAEYTDEMTLAALLEKYRICGEAIELFENSYAETYTFPGSTNMVGSILVYKPQNGPINDVMGTLTDVMTNVAGASASDIKLLSIEYAQKLVTGTEITDGVTENASVKATVTDGVAEYTLAHEDGLVDGAMSYTELTYTYSYSDGRLKVFKLPVYVEEPIYYGVHMKVMEGSVTSTTDIRKSGVLGVESGTKIVIANDSDYTLLMEFAYGKARLKMPETLAIDKSFLLKASNGQKKLAVGTKLRLIDVTHGNVPYYYTVESDDVTEVKFSEFKDSEGNFYVNQPICELPTETDAEQLYYTDLAADSQLTEELKALHQLEDAGVERYLLTVFNEDTSNMAYEIHTTMTPQILKADGSVDEQAGESAKTQFAPYEAHEEMPWFFVTAVPGLEISLLKTDNQTDIDGEISKEDTLTIKATILLDGDSMYWEYMNLDGLDSENSGKFLEIALYLRDETRVNLPEGTNVSYLIGTDDQGNKIYSENKVIQDNAVLYYYKDILGTTNLIDDLLANAKKADITIPVEFVLNFAGGDLSEFTSGSYEACIELLRTADSEYPMGSGNMLDIYTETVQAEMSHNLGFALKSINLEELAINTYPSALAENQIHYYTMFDFSDILKKISGVGEEEALAKWSGFDYEVTYELWKKTENGQNVVYERYEGMDNAEKTGDNIVISVSGVDAEGNAITSVSKGGSVTTTYRFNEAEIKNGTNMNEQQDGLVVRVGDMKLYTADLVSVSQDNLTNYKIVATMKVREHDAQTTGKEAETKDFFVFTVTKLKTDLSE